MPMKSLGGMILKLMNNVDPEWVRQHYLFRARQVFIEAIPSALKGRCCPLEVKKFAPERHEMPSVPKPKLVVLVSDDRIRTAFMNLEDNLTAIINKELGFEYITGLYFQPAGPSKLSKAIEELEKLLTPPDNN